MGEEIVGGLTAHTSADVAGDDLAMRADHRRRGVGRLLMSHLTRIAGDAGIHDLFVPADEDDAHALHF
jgi:aminoglycoside 3-N-acetyltransferase I